MRVAVLGIKKLPARAGADRVVERLLEHDTGKHEYTVYLQRDRNATLSCTSRRRYVYIPAFGGKHLRAASFFLLCSLHLLVRGSHDVVHVHNSDFGLVAPLLKLKRGVRIVGTFHGDPYTREKWGLFASMILRLSEILFVRTCDVLTSVAATKTVVGRVVHYIPNGVDLPAADAEDQAFDCWSLGLESGTYLLFACGRLDRTKGLHHLLSAYAKLPDPPPLLVIGDSSHDQRYAREIEAQAGRLAGVILLRELLPRESLLSAVRHASVFVFPSDVEAMSMMLLEAIGAGAFVVCSDIAENIAVVGSDYPFLFRAGDPASLGEVLERSLAAGSEPVAARLVERVGQTFRWERIAAEYEQLYISG
jgi:glycosyltransferase involved in cell wall biosynthesis